MEAPMAHPISKAPMAHPISKALMARPMINITLGSSGGSTDGSSECDLPYQQSSFVKRRAIGQYESIGQYQSFNE